MQSVNITANLAKAVRISKLNQDSVQAFDAEKICLRLEEKKQIFNILNYTVKVRNNYANAGPDWS